MPRIELTPLTRQWLAHAANSRRYRGAPVRSHAYIINRLKALRQNIHHSPELMDMFGKHGRGTAATAPPLFSRPGEPDSTVHYYISSQPIVTPIM